jgi:hypothetical protein
MTIISNHDAGNQTRTNMANPETTMPRRQLAPDIPIWVIPWAQEPAFPPQGDDGMLIPGPKITQINCGVRRRHHVRPVEAAVIS